jgi:hypothetical protein
MMNRDPVSGLSQRRSITNDEESSSSSIIEPEVKIDARKEPMIEINLIEESDEERQALELAIKNSLEDQQKPIVEIKNDLSNTVESSSDSDGKLNEWIMKTSFCV